MTLTTDLTNGGSRKWLVLELCEFVGPPVVTELLDHSRLQLVHGHKIRGLSDPAQH